MLTCARDEVGVRYGLLLATTLVAACASSDGRTPADTAASGPPTGGVLSFRGERPKNLLVISIDTTRRDALPRYGGDPTGLSFLDAIADEGVTLDKHHSCSNWTMASVTCVQTGRDNLDLGFVPRLQESVRGPLPDDTETLGTWLGDAGFYSVLASGNSWFSAEWNTDAGFSWSFPSTTGNATKLMWHGLWPLLNARITGQADRWYLHIHLVEPHAPYNPPDEYLGGLEGLDPITVDLSVKDEHYDIKNDWDLLSPSEQELLYDHLSVRYQAELAYMDDQIAYMWTHLSELGLLQDTLVVFWTDHGEAFWEHGDQTHAYSLYAEENDALAIFWADNLEPGSFDEPTSHIDLAPTILDALGLPIPDGITGYVVGTAPEDRPLFGLGVGKQGVAQSVLYQDRKLVYEWTGAKKAFYHDDTDPAELDDRYDSDDPEVLALWDLLMPQVDRAIELIPEHTAANPGP